ncbi:MAG TPA: four helix bundle protein [Candidatus Brocadiia bacterium]|nr:four helix bundle protein [Candidatus Brocadiales bacterium]
MKIKDYKDLKVWQKGIEIVDKIYLITNNFPKDELYGLTSQMKRAAISIPSNIAEGFVRHHTKEYIQFLYVSLGSCAELDTQLVVASKRNYVTKEKLDELSEDINHEARMLVSLINTVTRHS